MDWIALKLNYLVKNGFLQSNWMSVEVKETKIMKILSGDKYSCRLRKTAIQGWNTVFESDTSVRFECRRNEKVSSSPYLPSGFNASNYFYGSLYDFLFPVSFVGSKPTINKFLVDYSLNIKNKHLAFILVIFKNCDFFSLIRFESYVVVSSPEPCVTFIHYIFYTFWKIIFRCR